MTTDLTLNGVALSTAVPAAKVLDVRRPLVGARRDRFVDVPGKPGSWTFPEQPGDRVIEFVVDVQADSFADRRAALTALADWCDLGAVAPLIIDDEPDRYHEAILDDQADPREWLVSAEIPRLSFRVGPYALASDASQEVLAVSGAGSDSGSFSIPDEIDAEPVIEITPTNGTITGFGFTLGADELDYTGPTVTSGNTVTINTISDTVTSGLSGDTMLTGAYNPAALVMALVGGVFPLLEPGENTWGMTWDGTATAITVEISWRRRYR